MSKPEGIENLPEELQLALATIKQYQQTVNADDYRSGEGFDLMKYLSLDEADKFQRPSFPTHTQMERTIPKVGTVPFFPPKPYVFREYPKALHGLNAKGEAIQVVVSSAKAEQEKLDSGIWFAHPDEITEYQDDPNPAPKRRGRPPGSGHHKTTEATA